MRGGRQSEEERTLFHEGRGYTLYKGNCLEVLASLPEASIDMVFADPPYNLSNGGFTCKSGKVAPVHKGDWDVSRGIYQDHEFTKQWLSACQRVLKPNGTIWVSGTYHNIYSVGFALQKLGFKILNDIIWFKPNAAPNLSCRYFTASHETLLWAGKSNATRHTFNYDEVRRHNGGKQMRTVWEIPTPAAREKTYGKHPTQKPVELLRRIVMASSKPGDLILDPFSGSGTTGVAALQMNRRYIGIELDERYLELSRRRLEAVLQEANTTSHTTSEPENIPFQIALEMSHSLVGS